MISVGTEWFCTCNLTCCANNTSFWFLRTTWSESNVQNPCLRKAVQQLNFAFQCADRDGDGFVTVRELHYGLQCAYGFLTFCIFVCKCLDRHVLGVQGSTFLIFTCVEFGSLPCLPVGYQSLTSDAVRLLAFTPVTAAACQLVPLVSWSFLFGMTAYSPTPKWRGRFHQPTSKTHPKRTKLQPLFLHLSRSDFRILWSLWMKGSFPLLKCKVGEREEVFY